MELWLLFAGIGVFIAGVFVYVMFMVFLPEWVGISGQTAREAEKSHRGDSGENPEGGEKEDLISRLEKKNH